MQTIDTILFREPRGVLSLTGGGGKTSIMFHLARFLARSHKRVLTTTTTRILVPAVDQSATVLVNTDLDQVIQQASDALRATNHITAAASKLDNGKLQGFPPHAIGILQETGLFDWILVEADGAARRPLKAPAEHEPVIPVETSVLLAVAGLEVIGCPLGEELVFRSDRAGTLMHLSAAENITEYALALLLAHPAGSFKGAPPAAHKFIFLNKADTDGRVASARKIADYLRCLSRPVAEAVIVGQALRDVTVHAVHPLTVRF